MFTLIPSPREIGLLSGTVVCAVFKGISLPPDSTALDLEAARLLQAEWLRVVGRELPISRAWQPVAERGMIALGAAPTPLASPEAYVLHITPEGITVQGEAPGRLWGVQTLRQLLRLHGEALPALHISDAPALRYRGVLLDVARRKVPTLETLFTLVDTLSLLKLNMLQLQVEHTFMFRRHPLIGQNCGSLSCEDILALDAHCRARGVELVPMLQSFGHMRNILLLEPYRHLTEHPDTLWSLNPTDPASLRFMDELYEEFLPCFSSGLVNIGCDETVDLGRDGGRSTAEVARIGKGRVYLNFVLGLHRLLTEKFGKRVMCWGDILLHYPELVPELPRDLIVLNWGYDAAEQYPQVQVFAEHGLPQIVCPGTGSWNAVFPRIDYAWTNVAHFVRDGKAAGALGMLNTDWGDGGHYNLLGNSLYSYAHGAEVSWAETPAPQAAFDTALGAVLFGAGGADIVQAIRALGAASEAPGILQPNACLTTDMLFASPLEDIRQRALEEETLDALITAAERAEQTFRTRAHDSLAPSAVADMHWAATAIDFAGRKCRTLRTVRALALSREPRLDRAEQLRQSCIALLVEHNDVVAAFEARWLAGNRRSEIDVALGRFAHAAEGLRAVIAWLQDHRPAFTAGDRVPLPTIHAFKPPLKEDVAALWAGA